MILRHLARLVPLVAASACSGGGTSAPVDAAPPVPDAYVPPAIPDFPAGFLFGTAIAPYQVEGNLHDTDWYQWESICDQCSGDRADDGPDFWNRYDTDLANAEAMHTNAIRLGIEWARIFPTEASFPDAPDAAAVARYHEILASARAHGQEPMVTLHHFSTPTWIQDMTDLENRRGWEDPATIDRFARWARYCGEEFGDEVDWWITINEPFAYLSAGYVAGVFPPGKNAQIDELLVAAYNMIDAHARAYDALHAYDTGDADGDGATTLVSIASHNRVFLPKDAADPDHVAAAASLHYLNNLLFFDAIVHGDEDRNFDGDLDDAEDLRGEPSLAGRADYLGVNYYGVSLVVPATGPNVFPFTGIPLMNDLDRFGRTEAMTDFGWAIYPDGFREVLDELTPYGLPLLITENGLADEDDDQRPRFLIDHLYVLGKAIADGVDVRGYYHWSLLDNFEWATGFCPRFGLYRVDFGAAGRPRTAGAGADVYRRIIDAHNVPGELFVEFPSYPPPDTFCPRVGL